MSVRGKIIFGGTVPKGKLRKVERRLKNQLREIHPITLAPSILNHLGPPIQLDPQGRRTQCQNMYRHHPLLQLRYLDRTLDLKGYQSDRPPVQTY